MTTAPLTRPVSPFRLLLSVNLLQGWRKLQAIRSQSRLLTTLILAFIVCYLGLAFAIFYRGMLFAGRFPGLGDLLLERLLFLLFAFLFVLLLFSNLVISYTNLFKNRESQFLLSMPIPYRVVFQWKFCESVLLASWAFLFLIAPLIAAFGITRGVPWHFYLSTVVFTGMSIILPGIAGAWLAILLARFMERRIFQLLVVGGALMLLVSAFFWLKPEPIPLDSTETRVLAVLDRMLSKTRFSEQPFLPSYWVSSGVLNWADGAYSASVFFGLVLFSHILLWGFISFTSLGTRFYEAASAVQSRGSVFGQWRWFQTWSAHRKAAAWKTGLLDRLSSLFSTIPTDVRALVVKDIRMFWRDTNQWGQTIVLFGLLGVYIINLRHFTNQLTNPFWVHLVSYLNLAACALNLSTLTTRFVYPQFSLEGKRLWIIGMAPLGLVQVLKVKFWMAGIASLVLTLGLITLSCHMLNLSPDRILFFAGVITVMTLTLTGLAVGLGAIYPNLKEDHPGKIVSGFGGTFCLVLSFVYILCSVVTLALGSPSAPVKLSVQWFKPWSLPLFFGLSFVLGYLPMRLALRRVAVFEH